jgi:hypothetical protein
LLVNNCLHRELYKNLNINVRDRASFFCRLVPTHRERKRSLHGSAQLLGIGWEKLCTPRTSFAIGMVRGVGCIKSAVDDASALKATRQFVYSRRRGTAQLAPKMPLRTSYEDKRYALVSRRADSPAGALDRGARKRSCRCGLVGAALKRAVANDGKARHAGPPRTARIVRQLRRAPAILCWEAQSACRRSPRTRWLGHSLRLPPSSG